MSTVDVAVEVARAFLQNIIVIDDNALKPPMVEEEPRASLEGQSLEPLEAARVDVVESPRSEADDCAEYDGFESKTVIDKFAESGIACTLLVPSADHEERTRLHQLAIRSDVIVLDWIIRPAEIDDSVGGRTSVDLVIDLLKTEQNTSGRARLLCIYTGAFSLDPVKQRIGEEVELEFSRGLEWSSDRAQFGGTRIVVLAKAGGMSDSKEAVSASMLPETIIKEFAYFVGGGLLPQMALESLAAVRDNSHHILGRFSSSMDSALLGHSARTSAADAQNYVSSLIGQELADVVAGIREPLAFRRDNMELMITERAGEGPDFLMWKANYLYLGENVTTAQEWKVALKSAKRQFSKDVVISIFLDEKNAYKDHAASSLLENGSDEAIFKEARRSEYEFSALSLLARDSSQRSRRESPVLKLGSLLVSEEEQCESLLGGEAEEIDTAPPKMISRFWLCIQPLCDSVRLEGNVNFPLVELRLAEKTGSKIDFVVPFGGDYIPLSLGSTRIRDMRFDVFRAQSPQRVVAASVQEGRISFESITHSYDWLGDLRLDKAHKILHGLMTGVGRVGVDEYDVFRSLSSG